MKILVKETLNRLLQSVPRKITITGTTTATGALGIPSKYQGNPLFGLYCTSATSLVFRRDAIYLTVMYQGGTGDTLIPRANTTVTVSAWTIG